MQSVEEFVRLMERVRDGADDAIQEFVARFEKHVLRVVRHQLLEALRAKFDSTDFVQDVWASFFALSRDYLDFKTPEALEAYLGVMTRNKVIEALRVRLQGRRYNVQREQSLDDNDHHWPERLNGADPTPSQVVVAREAWEELQGQIRPKHRPLLEMLRDGYSHREIAEVLDLDEKTVRRVVHQLAVDKRRHEPD
jgi:RNA polymerase sigma factor (sigma-70 family)